MRHYSAPDLHAHAKYLKALTASDLDFSSRAILSSPIIFIIKEVAASENPGYFPFRLIFNSLAANELAAS